MTPIEYTLLAIFVITMTYAWLSCRPRDAYDKAVQYLKEHPDEINRSWGVAMDVERAHKFPAHILFTAVSDKPYENGDNALHGGCLTMIKSGYYEDYMEGLARSSKSPFHDEIRNDSQVPDCRTKINVSNLHVFAEWQRRIDKHYGRKPPVWSGK